MNAFVRVSMVIFSMLFAVSGRAACVPVQGVVTSLPDATCRINEAVGSWQGTEAPDPLLSQIAPNIPPESVCVSVKGTGAVQFTGVGGLTSVGVRGLDTRDTITPLGFAGGVRSGLTGFAAQSVLTGTLGIFRNKKSGTLFTKDTATTTNTGVAAEILMIVGGTNDFHGATGTIAVAGQELGGLAIYTGQICLPD